MYLIGGLGNQMRKFKKKVYKQVSQGLSPQTIR